MQAISDHFDVAKSSVYNILNDFMNVIIINVDKFIRWPSKGECLVIEESFKSKAEFPGSKKKDHFMKLKRTLHTHVLSPSYKCITWQILHSADHFNLQF